MYLTQTDQTMKNIWNVVIFFIFYLQKKEINTSIYNEIKTLFLFSSQREDEEISANKNDDDRTTSSSYHLLQPSSHRMVPVQLEDNAERTINIYFWTHWFCFF